MLNKILKSSLIAIPIIACMGTGSAGAACSGSDTIYVDASQNGDGSNWTDAYQSLQTALGSVTADTTTEIHVAQGTYYPTTGTDRMISFQLANCVSIYGGYPTGGGTRDWKTYVTTLSGDIATPSDDSDNSYHVVFGDGTESAINNTAILDGFVISGGNADLRSNTDYKGGGYVTTTAAQP